MSTKQYIVFFRYQVPKVTSQMARRAYETATKELSDVQKTKVAGYLTHSTATAEKHYRMKEIGSAVDAFLRNLRGDSEYLFMFSLVWSSMVTFKQFIYFFSVSCTHHLSHFLYLQ